MNYNRALNAAVIGYVLVLILVAVSAAIYCGGSVFGAMTGALAVITLGSSYFHENAAVASAISDFDSGEYRTAYQTIKITAWLTPLSLAAGYLIAFATLIIGV